MAKMTQHQHPPSSSSPHPTSANAKAKGRTSAQLAGASASTLRGHALRKQALEWWDISSADFDAFFASKRGNIGETAFRSLARFASLQPDWSLAKDLLIQARDGRKPPRRESSRYLRKVVENPWTVSVFARAMDLLEKTQQEEAGDNDDGAAAEATPTPAAVQTQPEVIDQITVVAEEEPAIVPAPTTRKQNVGAKRLNDARRTVVDDREDTSLNIRPFKDIVPDMDKATPRFQSPAGSETDLSLQPELPTSNPSAYSALHDGDNDFPADTPATTPGLPTPIREGYRQFQDQQDAQHSPRGAPYDLPRQSSRKRPFNDEVASSSPLRPKRTRLHDADAHLDEGDNDEYPLSPLLYSHTGQPRGTSLLGSPGQNFNRPICVEDLDSEATRNQDRTPGSRQIPDSLVSPKGRLDGNTIAKLLTIITACRPLTVTVADTGLVVTSRSPMLDVLATRQLETLLVPLHFQEPEHWALAAIPCSSNGSSVALFNSMADGTTTDIAQDRIRRFIADIDKAAEQSRLYANWSLFASRPDTVTIVESPCPQQKNGVDCGVALVVSALFQVVGKPMPARTDFSLWRDVLCLLLQGSSDNLDETTLLRRHYASLLVNWDDVSFDIPPSPSPHRILNVSQPDGLLKGKRSQVMEMIEEQSRYIAALKTKMAAADNARREALEAVGQDLSQIRDVMVELEARAQVPPEEEDQQPANSYNTVDDAAAAHKLSDLSSIRHTLTQRRRLTEQMTAQVQASLGGGNGFLAHGEVVAMNATLARQTRRLEGMLRAAEDTRWRAERVRARVDAEMAAVAGCLGTITCKIGSLLSS